MLMEGNDYQLAAVSKLVKRCVERQPQNCRNGKNFELIGLNNIAEKVQLICNVSFSFNTPFLLLIKFL